MSNLLALTSLQTQVKIYTCFLICKGCRDGGMNNFKSFFFLLFLCLSKNKVIFKIII